MSDDDQTVRIDKWLWAARFFKTRNLAATAITNGRVQVNQARVKPSKHLVIGDRLEIRITPYSWIVEVLKISSHRGSAEIARGLFREDEQSIRDREQIRENLKLERQLNRGHLDTRPTKRDRQKIIRFKQSSQ
ncbi:MAG: RNA-binding S4 domain-containing protein [Candidatus Nanopelagicaceae bacterium]